MAYDDALFQLGMDLTRSSTAQKEDSREVAHLVCTTRREEDREVASNARGDVRTAGNHLIIDLHGARRLDDAAYVERTLRHCIEMAGALPLHMHLHQVAPKGGVAGVAVMSDSHISVRSWPEAGYVALDVFNRGPGGVALSIDVLKAAFQARSVTVKTQRRGGDTKPQAIAAPVSYTGARIRTRARKAA